MREIKRKKDILPRRRRRMGILIFVRFLLRKKLKIKLIQIKFSFFF
jgi:hypothetical protein